MDDSRSNGRCQDGSVNCGCKEEESRFSCRHFVAVAATGRSSFQLKRPENFLGARSGSPVAAKDRDMKSTEKL
jgi:hypothetical protein